VECLNPELAHRGGGHRRLRNGGEIARSDAKRPARRSGTGRKEELPYSIEGLGAKRISQPRFTAGWWITIVPHAECNSELPGDCVVFVRLLAPQFLVLYAFVAATMVVHFRGRERLKFARQLTDHSTLLAPYNVIMYLFSAVPNKPVLSVSAVPDLAKLRDNWQTIRDEALNLFDQGRIKASEGYNDWGFNSFFRSGWKRFYLKWYADPLPSAERMCPRTVELLKSIPCIKGAMFASFAPGGRLVRHRDPFAGSLRYHLGLITPTHPGECRIFVDGIPYTWHDGEDLLFDETFIHYAENTTDQTRIILFCDVERPLRNRVASAMNRWVSRRIVKETATENEPGERIGVVNKVFGSVYHLRLLGKRMKTWNKNLYYAVKYSVVALILGAIVASAFN
jgi:beta-hydroxylase